MLLSNNEAALLLAIEKQCRVEEAFEWLVTPGKIVRLKDIDYLDMSALLRGKDNQGPVDFKEIAEIFNKSETYLKESYYKKITSLNLYDPRDINIDPEDLIIIKYLVEVNRPLETISERYPEYPLNIIKDALVTSGLQSM